MHSEICNNILIHSSIVSSTCLPLCRRALDARVLETSLVARKAS